MTDRSNPKVVFTGLNGKPLAIDLQRVESIEYHEDDETHLFIGGDHWFKVREKFTVVLALWRAA